MIELVLRAKPGAKRIDGVFTDRQRKTIKRDFLYVSSSDYAMQINAFSI